MTECTRFEDDLKAYADGELPLLRRLAVRRHLSRCLSCRKEILAMTQMTEDLRAADPKDALPPALREKLLQEPTEAQVPTLPKREGEELTTNPYSQAPRPPVSGGPLRSKEVGSRKRRAPAWIYAAAAVAAWFVCFPLFQHIRENSQGATMSRNPAPMAAEGQRVLSPPVKRPPPAAPQTYDLNGTAPPLPISAVPPPKALPAPTGNLTVRLSDREAGLDNGNIYVHIKSPDSDYQNALNATSNADPNSQRQVHKEASIGIQVPDPDATGNRLSSMVQETGGYVAADNLSTDPSGLKSGELIVKVPVTQFDSFLAQVAKLGVVQSKNISGEDITEKTSDANQAQIVQESDLQKAEARLKSLGAKAKWEDQENTRDLRVQLAQTRARLMLLKRMAVLGTLTIDLSQTPKAALPPPVTNGFTGSLKATTHDASQSLVGSAGALLALVIWLLAYAPIWVPLLLIGRYALKEYRKREAVSPKA